MLSGGFIFERVAWCDDEIITVPFRSLQIDSPHDVLEEILYTLIFHQIIDVIGSSECISVGAEEFNHPYLLLSHHLVSYAKPEVIPHVPSSVEHDNCLGNDQLLVSAITNKINCDYAHNLICWINVMECLFIGKDLS